MERIDYRKVSRIRLNEIEYSHGIFQSKTILPKNEHLFVSYKRPSSFGNLFLSGNKYYFNLFYIISTRYIFFSGKIQITFLKNKILEILNKILNKLCYE